MQDRPPSWSADDTESDVGSETIRYTGVGFDFKHQCPGVGNIHLMVIRDCSPWVTGYAQCALVLGSLLTIVRWKDWE